MTRKWLPAPCWVLVAPDGEIGAWDREGVWDGSHYNAVGDALGDQEEAADLAVENGDEEDAARVRSLHAAQLRTACHVVVCDGCGATYEVDDITIHFLTPAALGSGWTETDGVAHCRYCPALATPVVHVPGPGEDQLPGLEQP